MCNVTITLNIKKLKYFFRISNICFYFQILIYFQFLKYSTLFVSYGILFYKNFEMYTNSYFCFGYPAHVKEITTSLLVIKLSVK